MGPRASSLTCTVDGLAHLVSDEAAEAGIVAGRGTCRALCGHTVHTAPLVCSAGRPCPRCATHPDVLLAGQRHYAPRHNRRARRRSWLQRLLGQQPVFATSPAPRQRATPGSLGRR